MPPGGRLRNTFLIGLSTGRMENIIGVNFKTDGYRRRDLINKRDKRNLMAVPF